MAAISDLYDIAMMGSKKAVTKPMRRWLQKALGRNYEEHAKKNHNQMCLVTFHEVMTKSAETPEIETAHQSKLYVFPSQVFGGFLAVAVLTFPFIIRRMLRQKKRTNTVEQIKSYQLNHQHKKNSQKEASSATLVLNMSSASLEECIDKLENVNFPPGHEMKLVGMLIDYCSQERTFLQNYGLLSAHFCQQEARWKTAFSQSFVEQYSKTFQTYKLRELRNVAKLFSYLFCTDTVSWSVFSVVSLTENTTTSTSRLFLKILLQDMSKNMCPLEMKMRFETNDREKQKWFQGLLPTHSRKNTRYAIHFLQSIGLHALTKNLQESLKPVAKAIPATKSTQTFPASVAHYLSEENSHSCDSSSSQDSVSVASSSSSSSASSSCSSRSSGSTSSRSSSSYDYSSSKHVYSRDSFETSHAIVASPSEVTMIQRNSSRKRKEKKKKRRSNKEFLNTVAGFAWMYNQFAPGSRNLHQCGLDLLYEDGDEETLQKLQERLDEASISHSIVSSPSENFGLHRRKPVQDW